ncbi:phosphonate metabolism protein PhnM [Dendrosporobacter sp. 1207_IL3150]|uniref:phosphonate metabolism protein PhnM n=1 Tax=Dendrosporobacter sp. 1207_IL3150 TaxID=3084054 RepID=UPI002FDA7F89
MYLITNGQVVTEDAILESHEVLIRDGLIEGIFPSGTIGHELCRNVIDANGGYISPGFIDIHADFIETMASPRPTSVMDFGLSIRETEKVLIGHGITTMFHSLSLYKEDEFGFKPIRQAKNVRKLIDLIDASHNRQHLIRHRFHARFEIDNFDEIENLKQYLDQNKVHLVSFMDHSPGQGQYRDLEVFRTTLKGYKDITDQAIDGIIAKNQLKEKLTIQMIKEIADLASEKNIAIASHDDDTVEKVELVQHFGATISEFPITLDVAKEAKRRGMYTIAGAPNVLLGGSHSGNLCAATATKHQLIDILCSDYYPASLLHAVFILHEKHGLDLGAMFNLVSINPAKAVKMDNEIGSIKKGKKADIIVINKIDENYPAITAVLVDGKLVTRTHYRV